LARHFETESLIRARYQGYFLSGGHRLIDGGRG
jgi:hypothetical protein